MRLFGLSAALGVTSAAIIPQFESLARRQLSSSSASSRIPEGYTTTQVVTSIFANGSQRSSGSAESTIPFQCSDGCWGVAGTYFFCFVNTTAFDGSHSDVDQCNQFFCNSTNYEHLSQCLNCIIANGDERPFGYHTNTSLTAEPTRSAESPSSLSNPNGLIDLDVANAMLKNVTDRCESIDQAISSGQSSITATPTTTGPYYTSWTNSATLDLPAWTGLSQWASEAVQTYVQTVPIETEKASSGTAGTAAASSSNPASGGNSAGSRLQVEGPVLMSLLAGSTWAIAHWM
ncbi:hypothetical protein IAU59_005513 [Kwoniella sp. CBS 9459]